MSNSVQGYRFSAGFFTVPRLMQGLLAVVLFGVLCTGKAVAEGYSANFKNTDIEEFINTVSKNLNKTVIIDPSVKGNITVRSYEELNDEQYYQFFLSVLEVYGFTVISMDDHLLKVIPSKQAKGAAIPLADGQAPGEGDEVVIRVVPVHNVAARDLVPLLRQLNDNAGIGSVVHYESSNVLLITGRAAVVNRLLEIIDNVDRVGDQTVESVTLKHASSVEVARLVTALTKPENGAQPLGTMVAKVVADERTNAILVSGEEIPRQRAINIIQQLDKEQRTQGNTRVISLKYAKAASLVEVLTGVSASLQDNKEASAPGVALLKNVTIKADELTNALIITAAPDVMRELEQVIEQLDIRRAQVLVEAIIVEVQDADGLNLGVQWLNTQGGGTQFTDTGASVTSLLGQTGSLAEAAAGVNGVTAGFYRGNWAALFTALATNSQNDILATPSIVTLDNMEAEFNVGQDVPILTGSQTTNSDNVFNTVSRKSVGIKLKVKPQINQGDSVLLQIEQEVSSVAENSPSSTETLGATFNTRTVNNAVLVGNGQTVVVGGLLDKTNSDVSGKVPLLGDIPGIGFLFRSSNQKNIKRNLMLFIRPTIIREQEVYSQETQRKLEHYQAALPEKSTERGALPAQLTTGAPVTSTAVFQQVERDIQNFLAPQSR